MKPNLSVFYRRNLTVYFFFELFRSLIFIVPMWVAYERQFISNSQLLFLEGLMFASQMVLELPTGALADLLGKRLTVASGYFVKFKSPDGCGF